VKRKRARQSHKHCSTSALACPEIGVKWFLLFFCLFMSNMGLFDRQILAVLTDGKSRELRQILQEAGFSHTQTPKKGINTIFNHFRDKPARALEKARCRSRQQSVGEIAQDTRIKDEKDIVCDGS